jgi:hypothetical protein
MSSSATKKYKTVTCPEAALPPDLMINRRAREASGGDRLSWSVPTASSSSSSYSSERNGRGKREKHPLTENEEFRAKREELRKMTFSVKEFNAHAELGSSRKKFDADRLTRLGVLPPKQTKMPFKIRLRIEAAQKKRATKKMTELRESHEVVAKSALKKRNTNGDEIDTKRKKKKQKQY